MATDLQAKVNHLKISDTSYNFNLGHFSDDSRNPGNSRGVALLLSQALSLEKELTNSL